MEKTLKMWLLNVISWPNAWKHYLELQKVSHHHTDSLQVMLAASGYGWILDC